MVKTPNHLEEFLTALGLETREIEAFKALLERGTMTALELSRHTSIPRTTLYRIIESLKRKGIVEDIVDEYVAKVKAASISRLEYMVQDQRQRAESLVSLFPNVQQFISQAQLVSQPNTKVLMYRGREGIRQMIWNVLDAKSEVVGYSYRLLDNFAGKRFMDRFRSEFVDRKLKGRDVYSDEYRTSIKGTNYHWSAWKSRYIESKVLNINHQFDIYNDVIAIYNWHEGEVFGVEVHNEKVARMQRQMFEIIWGVSEKVK